MQATQDLTMLLRIKVVLIVLKARCRRDKGNHALVLAFDGDFHVKQDFCHYLIQDIQNLFVRGGPHNPI